MITGCDLTLGFVHDGEAVGFENTGRYRFWSFLMVPWSRSLRRMRYN